jgi:hypothetical protein
MNKTRKVSAIIAAVITATVATGVSVFAANTTDQYWHANYDDSWYCYYGRKDNDSSIYVKNNYHPSSTEGNPVRINIYASTSTGNPYTNKDYACKYNGVKLRTKNLYLAEGAERIIYSFVYENLRRLNQVPYAWIEFQAMGGNARGVWSPDTAGEWNYQCLNPEHQY